VAKSEKPTTRQIEKKFNATAFRLNQERNDFFLPQVRDFVESKKWMNLQPEYQRRLVWNDDKRSLFIESLLLNVPIPPVFLYEWDLSRYEVMDGQQRLNSIVDFYSNRFALRGLERWKELNGFRFDNLPQTLQRGLDRRRISATVLLVGGDKEGIDQDDVRKLVFERLNTGGQNLNPQELRNCLYAGPFNELLIALSQHPLFTKIWKIPSSEEHTDKHGTIDETLRKHHLYRRMIDCELVLRFFAFRKRTNIKGSVRAMLDRFMKENQNADESEIKSFAKDFESRLRVAHDIFGSRTFQYEDENGEWQLSHTIYDGVMVALDRLWDHRSQLISAKPRVVAKLAKLLKNESDYEVIIGKPNTAGAVSRRMDLLENVMKGAL
jgi:hypothetical protein